MKTSEFPVGTVVEVVNNDTKYEKCEGGNWQAIDGHCVDCMASDFISEIHIDEAEVKIISMPFGVVWQMAIMLSDEYGDMDSEGELITFDRIIKDAVDEYEESKKRASEPVPEYKAKEQA